MNQANWVSPARRTTSSDQVDQVRTGKPAKEPPALKSEADSVDDLPQKVIAVLASATAPQSRAALREQLRVNNQRLGDALQALLEAGRAARSDLGWSLA